MEHVDLEKPGNSDFEYIRDVSQWLVLYPNADFRAHFRLDVRSPVVDRMWATDGLNAEDADPMEVISGQLYMRSPVERILEFNGLTGYYDVRLEDQVSGHKITVFGGTLSFLPVGVTR